MRCRLRQQPRRSCGNISRQKFSTPAILLNLLWYVLLWLILGISQDPFHLTLLNLGVSGFYGVGAPSPSLTGAALCRVTGTQVTRVTLTTVNLKRMCVAVGSLFFPSPLTFCESTEVCFSHKLLLLLHLRPNLREREKDTCENKAVYW